MIQRAIRWDWKSLLVFWKKLPKRKGICSQAYLKQVREPIIFLAFERFGDGYIFKEDSSNVYKGKANYYD